MNLRTMAFAAIALIAFGTGAVSFAQTAPGPQSTPPPPPVPSATSPAPSPLPSTDASPAMPAMTPTPAPDAGSPTPSLSPTTEGRRRGHAGAAKPEPSPSPTDTPEPPQFSTLDGVWEVALQPLTGVRTKYSHLYVTQTGNTLTGTWKRDAKTALPFTGTFDGRLFKLTVTDGATTELLSGYEENYMDIVGLYTTADAKAQGTPFTAAHRKREKDRDTKPPIK